MSVISRNLHNLSFQINCDLGISSKAVFDKRFRDKQGEFLYRYSLTHSWQGAPKKRLVFLMLNPSTADAFKADPTVSRCMVWAQKWGYGVLEVVNIFAFRATDPKDMKKAEDPVGPLNNDFLRDAAAAADLVIAAWGAHGDYRERGLEVGRKILKRRQLSCLDIIESGHPKHPLYIKGATIPRPFSFPEVKA